MAALLAAVFLCPSSGSAWEAAPALVAERVKELDRLWARLRKAKRDPLQEIYSLARQAETPGWVTMPYWAQPYKGKTYFFGVGVCSGEAEERKRYEIAEQRARERLAAALGQGQPVMIRTKDGQVEQTTFQAEVKGEHYLDWYSGKGEKDRLYVLAVLVR